MDVGQLCMKIAGRDAGKGGVVLDVIDEQYVMLDGEVRRRKCNINHLEPLKTKMKIAKNASRDVVIKEFDKLGIKLAERKPRKPTKRQRKQKVDKKVDKKQGAPKAESKKAAKPKKEKASSKDKAEKAAPAKETKTEAKTDEKKSASKETASKKE